MGEGYKSARVVEREAAVTEKRGGGGVGEGYRREWVRVEGKRGCSKRARRGGGGGGWERGIEKRGSEWWEREAAVKEQEGGGGRGV